ncbi:hypothetical protein HPG69_007899, partial [Diceros bicornis minor]
SVASVEVKNQRHSPIVLPLYNLKGTSGSCLPARALHGMPPYPHPGPPPAAPPPLQNVLSPTFYSCLDSNFSLLYLNPEHLLEQITLWVRNLTFLIVEVARQWRSVPSSAGWLQKKHLQRWDRK